VSVVAVTLVPTGFLATRWLLLFLAVAALAAAYVAMQFRRRQYAVRFTNLDLLDQIAPQRPEWRRHVPAAALLVGLSALVVAMARPTAMQDVPRERATIIVAVDTSLSMMATDVEPNRMEAAKTAAASFVDLLPPKVNVGLVSFNQAASVLVSPTTDHEAVKRAIAGLELGPGTAIGEAILAGLDAIDSAPPAPGGELAPGRIVLMSDGETTVGRPNELAAERARELQVPVSTIAFGTPRGSIAIPGFEGRRSVPVDKTALEAIANDTDGSFFEAANAAELESVYADIGSSIGFEQQEREMTTTFVGLAVLALFAAAGFSLLWFSRLP